MTPQFALKCWNCLSEVSNDRYLARSHAIELCRIDFKVNDLGIRSETGGVASDSIIETSSENQQEISLVQRHVCGARAMHADHPQVVRNLWHNGTESVN